MDKDFDREGPIIDNDKGREKHNCRKESDTTSSFLTTLAFPPVARARAKTMRSMVEIFISKLMKGFLASERKK